MDSSPRDMDAVSAYPSELYRRPFVEYCKFSQDALVWVWYLTTPAAYDMKVWPR